MSIKSFWRLLELCMVCSISINLHSALRCATVTNNGGQKGESNVERKKEREREREANIQHEDVRIENIGCFSAAV